jgi:hypothetical protein
MLRLSEEVYTDGVLNNALFSVPVFQHQRKRIYSFILFLRLSKDSSQMVCLNPPCIQYFNIKQKTMPNGLGMGGQLEYFGFWIDSEFGLVRTAPSCTTFYSPQVH